MRKVGVPKARAPDLCGAGGGDDSPPDPSKSIVTGVQDESPVKGEEEEAEDYATPERPMEPIFTPPKGSPLHPKELWPPDFPYFIHNMISAPETASYSKE